MEVRLDANRLDRAFADSCDQVAQHVIYLLRGRVHPPFAENELQRGVQKYLGAVSAEITHEACQALENGDPARIGELMRKAQAEFDKHLQPACPSELTAPVLHKVLSYPPIQPHVLGGKGVGSQGDGSVQFIVKDEESQRKVVEILERELRLSCLKLVLASGPKVRKAVIPAAGFGTRLFPASKVVKKELFPVIDRNGRAKPAILAIIEEAIASGIEELCLIVQAEDRGLFEDFFNNPPRIENFNRLSREDQEYCRYLADVGHRITLVAQTAQEGFGHAVFCAREWVGKEPFLLMLGDHLYASTTQTPCARQVLDAHERLGQSIVGLKITRGAEVGHFGCVAGIWQTENSTLSITEFAEKPSLEYAQKHLAMEGIEKGCFLTVFGQYVLKPRIFEILEENIRNNVRDRGEFQLTSCLDRMRQEDGFMGIVVQGRRFDIGLPEAYRETVIDFRNA